MTWRQLAPPPHSGGARCLTTLVTAVSKAGADLICSPNQEFRAYDSVWWINQHAAKQNPVGSVSSGGITQHTAPLTPACSCHPAPNSAMAARGLPNGWPLPQMIMATARCHLWLLKPHLVITPELQINANSKVEVMVA
jgi:hypothetical protein